MDVLVLYTWRKDGSDEVLACRVAAHSLPEEGAPVGRENTLVIVTGYDREATSRIVIQPLTVEVIVVRVIDVQLCFGGIGLRLVVELCPVVVHHVAVRCGKKCHEGVAVRLPPIATRVARSQGQHPFT